MPGGRGGWRGRPRAKACAVGPGDAKAGVEEYVGRLRPWTSFQMDYLKSGTRESESALLLDKSEGLFRIALDERGEQLTSRALAGRISAWEQSGTKGIAILIGLWWLLRNGAL